MSQAIDGVYLVQVFWENGGPAYHAMNSFHVRDTSGGQTAAKGQEAMEAVESWLGGMTDLKGILPSNTKIIKLAWCGVADETIGGEKVSTAFVGTATDHPSSLRNAVMVFRDTGKRGRSYHGRFYLPAPVESVTASGVITPAELTKLQAEFGVNAPTQPSGFQHVIVQTREKLPDGSRRDKNPWTCEPVSQMVVRGIVATIRGRQKIR